MLALDDAGVVYSWGGNEHGQLGVGNKEVTHSAIVLKPVISDCMKLGIREIVCHYLSAVSIAVTCGGDVFMWGHCGDIQFKSPFKTLARSVQQVFDEYIYPTIKVTLEPLCIDENSVSNQQLNLTLNDQASSDIKFAISGKFLYAHKMYLQMRCSYFNAMFSAEWKESKSDTIEITEYSFDVYKFFLEYLYTDQLPSVNQSTDFVLELLKAANFYGEEKLKSQCEKIMCKEISMDQVCTLYELSCTFECTMLQKFCLIFAFENFIDVVKSDGFKNMDATLCKTFVVHASKRDRSNIE